MGGFGRETIMKGVIEALAAFILAHTYGSPILASQGDAFGTALTIGLSYMLIIGGLRTYANPAIHFGKAFQGTVGWIDAFWFFFCQIIGAMMGFIISNMMFDASPNIFGMSADVTQVGTLLYFEGLYSTVIVLITLRSDDNSTEKDEAKEAATSIAAAYSVGNFLFGAKTGGIFNPAIAFGNALSRFARWQTCAFWDAEASGWPDADGNATREPYANWQNADGISANQPACAGKWETAAGVTCDPDEDLQGVCTTYTNNFWTHAGIPGTDANGNAITVALTGGPSLADFVSRYGFLWVHILAPYAGAFGSAVFLWMGSDDYGIFWDPKGVEMDA